MRTLRLVALVILVVVAVIFCTYTFYYKTDRNENFATSEISEEGVAKSVLSYAVDPMFSSDNLLNDLIGTKAKLEMYLLNEGKVYFSLPTSED